MNVVLTAASVSAVYAVGGFVVVRMHDRPVPLWWCRMAAAVHRTVRALAAIPPRVACAVRFRVRRLVAVARMRWSLLSFSLHVLLFPMGVSHR